MTTSPGALDVVTGAFSYSGAARSATPVRRSPGSYEPPAARCGR